MHLVGGKNMVPVSWDMITLRFDELAGCKGTFRVAGKMRWETKALTHFWSNEQPICCAATQG